ncbi:MAG: S8 family serine peptidase [bacterium]|nr:S8 family serine peptidase [bacterium]
MSRLILAGFILWAISGVSAQARPILAGRLEKAGKDETFPVLVYFTDKGISAKEDMNGALQRRRLEMTPRALKRRAKTGREQMTYEDLPVCPDYVGQIQKTGALPRQRLNWFNAASFEMTGSQVKSCQELSFVKKIELLPARSKRTRPELETTSPKAPEAGSPKAHLLNYGLSHAQLHLSAIDVCHDSGYSGIGVLVAMFDNGFRKGHQAFDSIRADGRLLDEWDFVTNADTVAWDSHGTGTWSEAGGYVPGQLIGPAYKASWAIYHTEDMSQEMPVEEDHWAAALQRADSLGADVVSSSLGYRDFVEDPLLSYTYEDLDGNTAISTLAARHAAALGIVVCNAMGNSGYDGIGSLVAPSDADSILSVGNVDSIGVINSSSSLGPTYDGRPKPEVCAQGTLVWWASWTATTAYGRATGTSCATPLVAGACALILEAHPDWTPMQVREALMMTASRSANPDSTTYGWGVINVWAAINYFAAGVLGQPAEPPVPVGMMLSCRPNPLKAEAVISFAMPSTGSARLSIYDITGRQVYQVPMTNANPGVNHFSWNGRDQSGRLLGNGVYFCRVNAGDHAGTIKVTLIR